MTANSTPNLLERLTDLLSRDDRLVSEGKLLKNKVTELALNLDASLLKLLLTDPAIKAHFFTEVDTVLVFDKIKFQKFVNNKQFLPDSYTAYKNKIGLTTNDEYLTDSKEVVLSFPYKDCILEGGQDKEDAKRDEIFWNETLAPEQIDRLLSPKLLTNFKRYTVDGVQELSTASQPASQPANYIIA
jgi:adenine-specific DNA-methyltransferase